MREGLKIVALVVVAALGYGVLHDQVTARVSLEYFTVGKAPLFPTESPTLLGLAWGITGTWWAALPLGVLLALAARAGARPPLSARQLRGPVLVLLGVMALAALLAALSFHRDAAAGAASLPEELAARIPDDRHARFQAVSGAHAASYFVGLLGSLVLCGWTGSRRARPEGRALGLRRAIGQALMAVAAGGGLLLVLGPPAMAWYLTGLVLRPPWYVHPGPGGELLPGERSDPRTDLGLAYEDVEFPTTGGARLRGWLVPAASETDAAVVLAHGAWGDRRSTFPVLPAVREAGYAALLFDYREHGVSDGSGRGSSLGLRESEDVSAAVRYLERERGFERIAVAGFSMGGTAAVLAAADDPAIDAVVAASPGTTLPAVLTQRRETRDAPPWMQRLIARVYLWRIGAPFDAVWSLEVGPLYVIDRIAPRPIFLIHGLDDDVMTPAEARTLLRRAGEPKRLVFVEGAGHADIFEAGSAYREALTEFLTTALDPP